MTLGNPKAPCRRSASLIGQSGKQLQVLHQITPERSLQEIILDPSTTIEDLESAWRLLKQAPHLWEGATPLHMSIFGQCSLHGLAPALNSLAWASRRCLVLKMGGYDLIHQDISSLTEPPEVVALIPWSHRITPQTGDPSAQIASELAPWETTWNRLSKLGCGRLIQVGYDWIAPGADGLHLGSRPGGTLDLIRTANKQLMATLPASAYFLDLEALSGMAGREVFYDLRQYHWTKRPFSQIGTAHLARELWTATRCLTSGPRKVLVLDLDNTLWGGVLGELGVEGIVLGDSTEGEAFQAFQRHIKNLSARGVLLALATKNDEALVRKAFKCHPNMVLQLEDFAAIEAHWEPKSESLRRIARTLNVHLDSLVFFDDNPAERTLIRQLLPEVATIEVPEDPCQFISTLTASRWFEVLAITREDQLRTAQYASEQHRKDLASTSGSIDKFLTSLSMSGIAAPISEPDFDRATQLLQKTNQFNLTTRRYTREQLRALLSKPGAIGLGLRMRDRFGDFGLIGITIALPDPLPEVKSLRIDTFLLSCRVIGRTAEHFLLNALIARAREQGVKTITGIYIPTPKNGVVASLWEDMGFEPYYSKDEPEHEIAYQRSVDLSLYSTYIEDVP